MQHNQVLLLGGFGKVGLAAATYLLQHTQVELTLASRQPKSLPVDWPASAHARLKQLALDITDPQALAQAISHACLVISCVGPSGLLADKVAQACKQQKVPLVDAGGYDPVLQQLEQDQQQNPTTVPLVINVGLLPGLSGMFPHYMLCQAPAFQTSELTVQYVGRDAWSFNSAFDIIHGLGDFGAEHGFCFYQDGAVQRVPFRQAGSKALFPAPIGKVSTMLLHAEEIIRLARQQGVRTARVYGANIGPRAMLVCLIAKIFRMYSSTKATARAARWLVKASKRDMHKLSPTYGIAVELANPQGQRITGQIVLHDTYQATGTIIGITAKALLDQQLTRAGIYYLHEAIAPEYFFDELKKTQIIKYMNTETPQQTLQTGALA